MQESNITPSARELLQAWDKGVERAQSNTPRSQELSQEQLDSVAGLQIESGLKGGIWGSGRHTCTCGLTCMGCM